MIEGICHCGQVTFTFEADPDWLTSCNCSICRRLGTIWGHGSTEDIVVSAPEDGLISYSWRDGNIAFHTCKICGVTTHWSGIKGDSIGKLAVNCALADPEALSRYKIRQFDGAVTWSFID